MHALLGGGGALFQCSNMIITYINDKHMKLLTDVSSQFAVLPDDFKLLYVLKAHDADMTKIAGQWLYHVNETYKNNQVTQSCQLIYMMPIIDLCIQ